MGSFWKNEGSDSADPLGEWPSSGRIHATIGGMDGAEFRRRTSPGAIGHQPQRLDLPKQAPTARKNVLVVGLDDFNLDMLRHLRGANGIEYHRLPEPAVFCETEEFEILAMIDQATARFEAFWDTVATSPGSGTPASRGT